MASAAVGIWVGVGGRYESARRNGVSHFIEHMLFKGTARRSAREISEAVEGVGGYLNAFTSEENTCFHARAHHSRLEDLVDVLADMFLNSAFDPAEIDKEREVIKEEYTMYRDQPAQAVQELLNEASWPGHPLGRPLTGTPRTIDSLERADFLDHLATHYVAGTTVVAAAGHVEHAALVRLVKSRLGRFRPGTRPGFEPAPARKSGPVIRLHTRKTEQTQMALGIRTCSRHDPRRFALRLLNALLGESMSSRLFQTVREDRGLVYSIYSSTSFWEDTGDLVISAGLDPEKLNETLKLIANELHGLREKAPGKLEFNRARDYVIGQMDLALEGTENRMMALGEHLLGYGTVISPDATRQRLAKVTPAEIRAAARDFFHPEQATLALISPRRRIPGAIRILGEIA